MPESYYFLSQRREEYLQQRNQGTKEYLSKLFCPVTFNKFVQLFNES